MFKRIIPYLRPDGIGCSHWRYYASKPCQDVKSAQEDNATADIDEVDFMDDREDESFFDAEPNNAPTQPSTESTDPPALSDRPKLPTSIKLLNKALGRMQPYEIPESELIEQFVRGRGPGGQAINKTNSSVSLIHIPTGIRVQSQPTRSREQNRTAARHIMREKLEALRVQGLYTPTNLKEVKFDPRPKKAAEQELALAYTKGELRAAKERARKADRAKKHRQKKRRMEEQAGQVEPDGTSES